jgi:hypothetical protein
LEGSPFRSWARRTGSCYGDNCGTADNAKFNGPITFNIYAPPALGSNVPGALIVSRTQTFAIPYSPSANFAHCTGSQAGEWWNAALSQCFNGKLVCTRTLRSTAITATVAPPD